MPLAVATLSESKPFAIGMRTRSCPGQNRFGQARAFGAEDQRRPSLPPHAGQGLSAARTERQEIEASLVQDGPSGSSMRVNGMRRLAPTETRIALR